MKWRRYEIIEIGKLIQHNLYFKLKKVMLKLKENSISLFLIFLFNVLLSLQIYSIQS